MGGSAREVVLDIVSGFGCRNDSGGIYKLTSFTLIIREFEVKGLRSGNTEVDGSWVDGRRFLNRALIEKEFKGP